MEIKYTFLDFDSIAASIDLLPKIYSKLLELIEKVENNLKFNLFIMKIWKKIIYNNFVIITS